MSGEHRAQANGHRYRQAKARFVRAADPVCGVCKQYVDKSLPWPNPGSPSVDHIVPLAHGGNAMDMSLWQLSHLRCNRYKSDKLYPGEVPGYVNPPGPTECSRINHHSREHYPGGYTACPLGRGFHPVASADRPQGRGPY